MLTKFNFEKYELEDSSIIIIKVKMEEANKVEDTLLQQLKETERSVKGERKKLSP